MITGAQLSGIGIAAGVNEQLSENPTQKEIANAVTFLHDEEISRDTAQELILTTIDDADADLKDDVLTAFTEIYQ